MKRQVVGFVILPLLLVLASQYFDFIALVALGVLVAATQVLLGSRLTSRPARPGLQNDRTLFDSDSGLMNPWYFNLRVAEEARRCDRYGRPMAVIVLKVLLTKGVSADWRGESATAGHRCATVIRSVDLSSALAPFEYGICLVECNRPSAWKVYQRLVDQLPEYECLGGIAVYPADALAASDLVKTARVRSQTPQAA